MTIAGKLLGVGIDLDDLVRMKTVNIPSAEIKLLRATPKVLIPAQGSGTLILLNHSLVMLRAGTNLFTETAENFYVRYGDADGTIAAVQFENTGFIDQAVDMIGQLVSLNAFNTGIHIASNVVNKPLVLHNNGDGEIGGNAAGNASLTLKVFYRVVRF